MADNRSIEADFQAAALKILDSVRADIASGRISVYSFDGYQTPDEFSGLVEWGISGKFIKGPMAGAKGLHTNDR